MDYNIGNIPLIGYGFIGVTALALTYATMLDNETSGSKKESYSDTVLNSTPGIPAAEPQSDTEKSEPGQEEEEEEQEQEQEQEQKGGKRKKKTHTRKSKANHKRKQRKTKTNKEKK